MPWTTVVNTVTQVTSSFWHDNVRDQLVSRFSSQSARNSGITAPLAGMLTAITSNDSLEGIEFRNSAGQWRRPWNLPWGMVAPSAGITASQTGIGTAVTDITGCQVTWTAVANRWYRASFSARLDSNHGGFQVAQLLLRDETNTQTATVYVNLEANGGAGDSVTATGVWFGTRAAGTRSLKLSVLFTTGAGNAVLASGSEGAFVGVEDCGPAGAPS